MRWIKGMPGGHIETNVGTSVVTIDLRKFARQRVKIWCLQDDTLFSFAPSGAAASLVTGAQVADESALVAEECPKGMGLIRFVLPQFPQLNIRTSSLSGCTIKVKPVDIEDQVESVT